MSSLKNSFEAYMAANTEDAAPPPGTVMVVVEKIEQGETVITTHDCDYAISPSESLADRNDIAMSPTVSGSQVPPSGWPKRTRHRWKAPLLMVIFFLIGFAMSLAHCIFYPMLTGVIVGSPDSQEGKIRYVFSFE
jgi:thiol:disulfide interchange protein